MDQFYLVIATPVLLAIASSLLRRPEWGVVAIVAIQYANVANVAASTYQFKLFNLLVTGLAFGLAACYRILYPPSQGSPKTYFAANSVWLLAACVSLIFSISPDIGTTKVYRSIIESLAGMSVLLLITDWKKLVLAADTIAATCVALSVLTIVQSVLGEPFQTFGGFATGSVELISGLNHAWRPGGTINDPNFYGQMLLPGFAFAFNRILRPASPLGRAWGVAASLIIVTGILLTASRGAFVAVFFMILGFAVVQRKLSTMLTLAIVLAVGVLATPGTYQARLLKPLAAVSNAEDGDPVKQSSGESSVLGRLNEMRAAYLIFLSRPLTGVGFGQFEPHYQPTSIRDDLYMRPKDRSAHSLYLEVAAEQGLVGLAALFINLGLMYAALVKALRAAAGDRPRARFAFAMAMAASGYFAAAIFLHDAYPRYIWIMYALVFSLENLIRSRIKLPKRPHLLES